VIPTAVTSGAPVELGREQGAAFAGLIRAELSRTRSSLGGLARAALLRRVRGSSARSLETQLPWQRERIEGLAQGAGVSERLLLLAESLARVQAAVFWDGRTLRAAFELPPALAANLALRATRPDAGGFASAELCLAYSAGCLAGVNAEGIAVVVARDPRGDELSLRFLAQELLFRARDLDAGVDHLKRRASYSGGSGTLVAANARGEVRVLAFKAGALELRDPAELPTRPAACDLELDPTARRLSLQRSGASSDLSV
jgi:hypothetical protein